MLKLTTYAATATGARSSNQDSFIIGRNLCVVADGFGPKGGIAAQVVVQYLEKNLIGGWIGTRNDSTVLERIHAAILAAQKLVNDTCPPQQPPARRRTSAAAALQYSGCTIVLALIVEDRLFITWLGDSRAYLVRGGQLMALTQDHRDLNTNQVTRCLMGGLSNDPQPEFRVIAAQLGDGLLLCSDGLTGSVSEEDIQRIAARESPSQSTCDLFIQAALRKPKDNVTVVMAESTEE